jgi:hypothetical protein
MAGGVKSRRVGRVCGADVNARLVTQNSVCYIYTSSAPDDGCKSPKYVELRNINKITLVASH